MHRLFVSHSSLAVGVERSMLALVAASAEAGDEITVMLPGPGPLVDLLLHVAPQARVIQVRLQWWMGDDHVGLKGILKLVHAVTQVPGLAVRLRRLDADVVYVMSTVLPGPLLARLISPGPLVVFLSESVRDNPTLLSVVPKTVIARIVRRCADLTVAVSEYAAGQFGGADLIEYPDVLGRRDVSSDQGPPAGRGAELPTTWPRDVVMLGSLSPEKGQQDAVRAIHAARLRGADVTLTLYGNAKDEDLSDLRRLVSRLGLDDVVRHDGPTEDPYGVLTAADVSLVCSRNEAYGRVTAESLVVGTPVLAYDVGGTAEILRGGGGVGINASPEEMGAELAALFHDRARWSALRLAARARRNSTRGLGNAEQTLAVTDRRLFTTGSTATRIPDHPA